MKRVVCLCLFVVIQLVVFASGDEIKKKSIQHEMDALVLENKIPGLNFSIVYADGRQDNYSSGLANLKTKEPLNQNSVMFSGSVGKTYAVAILMQLVEAGKVDLKKKLISYFPDHKWLHRLPNISDISVEMLVKHTTGLPRYINAQEIWESLRTNPNKVWTYKERLSYIFDMEPLHEAGKSWAYSDSNYLLIGMLIEKITGSDYYDEVEKRLLISENLKSTYPATQRDVPNLPVAYSKLPEFFRMPEVVVIDGEYVFNPQMEWTGGGMASTTSDLARWAKLYYEAKMFSKSSLDMIIVPNENGQNLTEGYSYGMGSFIYKTDFGKAYGHTGFVPGFNSIMAYFPQYKIAVALQSNCDFAKTDMSFIEYLNRILENVIPDLSNK